MTLQEQLAQPQRATVHLPLFAFGTRFEDGLLGNNSVQSPTPSAGVAFFTEFIRDLLAEALAPPIASAESAEMAWLVQHAQELSQHKGEWLLIRDRELLVHSRNFEEVRAAIKQQQIRLPCVYYVPTDEESNSVTI